MKIYTLFFVGVTKDELDEEHTNIEFKGTFGGSENSKDDLTAAKAKARKLDQYSDSLKWHKSKPSATSDVKDFVTHATDATVPERTSFYEVRWEIRESPLVGYEKPKSVWSKLVASFA